MSYRWDDDEDGSYRDGDEDDDDSDDTQTLLRTATATTAAAAVRKKKKPTTTTRRRRSCSSAVKSRTVAATTHGKNRQRTSSSKRKRSLHEEKKDDDLVSNSSSDDDDDDSEEDAASETASSSPQRRRSTASSDRRRVRRSVPLYQALRPPSDEEDVLQLQQQSQSSQPQSQSRDTTTTNTTTTEEEQHDPTKTSVSLYRIVTEPRSHLQRLTRRNPVLRAALQAEEAGIHATTRRQRVMMADDDDDDDDSSWNDVPVRRYLSHLPPDTFACPDDCLMAATTATDTTLPNNDDDNNNNNNRKKAATTDRHRRRRRRHWLTRRLMVYHERFWKGTLTVSQAVGLQRANRAFWECVVTRRRPDDNDEALLQKWRREYHDRREKEQSARDNDDDDDDDSTPPPCVYREITDLTELQSLIGQNPVLRDIQRHGGTATRAHVYPPNGGGGGGGDDDANDYLWTYLQHFPKYTYALPASFAPLIRGLHGGHWLQHKVQDLQRRRWRLHVLPAAGGSSSTRYGALSVSEVDKIRSVNPAFWLLYVNPRPTPETLWEWQARYERRLRRKEPHPPDAIPTDGSAGSSVPPTTTTTKPDHVFYRGSETYKQIVDPYATDRLQGIVDHNPVLRKIQQHGTKAKRKDLFPEMNADFVVSYLQHFPPDTFALPNVFSKVIPGLHAPHFLAVQVADVKRRRWRTSARPEQRHGALRSDEVRALQAANPAFWECHVQDKPSDEELRKQAAQYASRTKGRRGGAKSSAAMPRAGTTQKPPPKAPPPSLPATVTHEIKNKTYSEIIDPNATLFLEKIIKGNPVLSKIRQCGGQAKRSDVYPTVVPQYTLEPCALQYLRSFPKNTYASPAVFRKVIPGLDASHWLTYMIKSLRERRWRDRRSSGKLTRAQVQQIQSSNMAFWDCYVNQQLPKPSSTGVAEGLRRRPVEPSGTSQTRTAKKRRTVVSNEITPDGSIAAASSEGGDADGVLHLESEDDDRGGPGNPYPNTNSRRTGTTMLESEQDVDLNDLEVQNEGESVPENVCSGSFGLEPDTDFAFV